MKDSGAVIKAKNSEQWAAQKAAENERDKVARNVVGSEGLGSFSVILVACTSEISIPFNAYR